MGLAPLSPPKPRGDRLRGGDGSELNTCLCGAVPSAIHPIRCTGIFQFFVDRFQPVMFYCVENHSFLVPFDRSKRVL